MKRLSHALAVSIVAAAAILPMTGCATGIGALIGANTATRHVDSDNFETAIGKTVHVRTYTGQHLKATLLAVEDDPTDSAYIAEYQAKVQSLRARVALPALSSNLRIHHEATDTPTQVRYLGFGGLGKTYMIVQNEDGRMDEIPIDRIYRTVDEAGNEISVARYAQLMVRHALPKCTRVVLGTDAGVESFSAQDIASLSTPNRGTGALRGAVVGLVADAAVTYLIVSSFTLFDGPILSGPIGVAGQRVGNQ